jgi:hypothetical protein
LRLCCGYIEKRINDNKASLCYVKRVFSLSESPKKNNRKTTQTTKKKAAKKHKKKADSLSKLFLSFLFSLSLLLSFSSSSSSSSSFGCCRCSLVVSLSFGA